MTKKSALSLELPSFKIWVEGEVSKHKEISHDNRQATTHKYKTLWLKIKKDKSEHASVLQIGTRCHCEDVNVDVSQGVVEKIVSVSQLERIH